MCCPQGPKNNFWLITAINNGARVLLLCFFDKTSHFQIEKIRNGSMGNWEQWEQNDYWSCRWLCPSAKNQGNRPMPFLVPRPGFEPTPVSGLGFSAISIKWICSSVIIAPTTFLWVQYRLAPPIFHTFRWSWHSFSMVYHIFWYF